MSDKNPTQAPDGTPCPRCGGPPASRRTPNAANPFLSPSDSLVCDLCGLDYERGAPAWARQPPGSKPGSGSGPASGA